MTALRALLLFVVVATVVTAQATPKCEERCDVSAALSRARPRADEERWRLIPFGDSLVEALAIAKRERRPVFFFGYDGILDNGYC